MGPQGPFDQTADVPVTFLYARTASGLRLKHPPTDPSVRSQIGRHPAGDQLIAWATALHRIHEAWRHVSLASSRVGSFTTFGRFDPSFRSHLQTNEWSSPSLTVSVMRVSIVSFDGLIKRDSPW